MEGEGLGRIRFTANDLTYINRKRHGTLLSRAAFFVRGRGEGGRITSDKGGGSKKRKNVKQNFKIFTNVTVLATKIRYNVMGIHRYPYDEMDFSRKTHG